MELLVLIMLIQLDFKFIPNLMFNSPKDTDHFNNIKANIMPRAFGSLRCLRTKEKKYFNKPPVAPVQFSHADFDPLVSKTSFILGILEKVVMMA